MNAQWILPPGGTETLMRLVLRVADCDPQPTTDDEWCYFCGYADKGDGSVPHDDHCLWLIAAKIKDAQSPGPAGGAS